jgi:hypothetical protein
LCTADPQYVCQSTNTVAANKFRNQPKDQAIFGTAQGVSALTGHNKSLPGRSACFRTISTSKGYGEEHDDRGDKLMPNDEAALAYARRIIRELTEAGGYRDPRLTMIVRNSAGKTVHSIPFMQH